MRTTEPRADDAEAQSPKSRSNGHGNGHDKMVGATLVIMAGVLLSRLLGLVRVSIIAHQFGQGYSTDIYNAAFTIPDVIFYLIAGGALSSSFIPVFTEYIERGEEREAWRLFSVVSVATTLVVGAFIVVGELLVYPLVKAFNPGFPVREVADTAALTRILLPAQICFFLGGLMNGALQVRKDNMGQAFGPCIYNLGIIFGGLFLIQRFGVAGLCWGAVAGAIIGNLIFQWVLVRRKGGVFATSVFRHFHHPGAIQVWNLMWPILLGLALPQVCPIVNKLFASFLGKGAMSALMNSNMLMQVPLGIFGQACSIAIFPLLAQQVARGENVAFRRTLSAGIRLILFLTVPSSAYIMVLAKPIVQLLFQSGKFTGSDLSLTATLLVAYTIGLFAWSAQSIVARGFYAHKDSKTPVVVGTLVTVIFVIANYLVLKGTPPGPNHSLNGAYGLAIVTSCAAILNTGVLVALLRRKLGGIDGIRLAVGTFKILIASALFAVACRATLGFLESHPLRGGLASVKVVSTTNLLVCAIAGILVYATMTFVLRMDEARMLIGAIRRRRSA